MDLFDWIVLIVIFLVATLIYSIIELGKHLYSIHLRKCFAEEYHISELPDYARLAKNESGYDKYYTLAYPRWAFSNKDGTADNRRRGHNGIIWRPSYLYLGRYRISTSRPDDMIDLVEMLRAAGNEISQCKEEIYKYNTLLEKRELLNSDITVKEIVDYYKDNPTGFEELCAMMFRNLGYTTRVTPPTNDGGYDIWMKNEKGDCLVECKLYSISHKIGRPAIQKLVGANAVENARKMIFITTSDYTPGALEYARECGVTTINCNELVRLLRQSGLVADEEVSLTYEDCKLDVEDLEPHIPKDIYRHYFKRNQGIQW